MSNHYPSLFLIVNSDQAKWFQIEENSITSIDGLREEPDQYPDNEGKFSGMGQGVGGGPEVMNHVKKDHEVHHLKNVASHTAQILKEGSFEHISIAVPDRYKNDIQDAFKHASVQIEPKMVFGDYIHATSNEIRDLFLKSLRPQE